MENLTCELYESPMKERNEEKYGEYTGCVCCARPMKDNEKLQVHMNIAWKAVHNSVTDENCKKLTGDESQGAFPIGTGCAKKMPKEFIITVK